MISKATTSTNSPPSLFNTWRIGKSDNNNGILILVAKDRRKATIRTGYGAEGVLPDITAGRILRKDMFPKFRDGDYEGGLLAGVEHVYQVVTDPEAASELHSDENDNYHLAKPSISSNPTSPSPSPWLR